MAPPADLVARRGFVMSASGNRGALHKVYNLYMTIDATIDDLRKQILLLHSLHQEYKLLMSERAATEDEARRQQLDKWANTCLAEALTIASQFWPMNSTRQER